MLLILTAANQKKYDFHSELFDAVVDLPPEKIDIDNTTVTEDIFIDDDLFSDTDIKGEDKTKYRRYFTGS